MPNQRLAQAIACAFLFFCAAATAQSTTKATSTSPSPTKAVSVTLDGLSSTTKALQPRTLLAFFVCAYRQPQPFSFVANCCCELSPKPIQNASARQQTRLVQIHTHKSCFQEHLAVIFTACQLCRRQ